jgi:phage-related protein
MMAEDIRKDPSLLTNKAFVSSHPQLTEFLDTHAGVAKEIQANPAAFVKDEEYWQKQSVSEREASTKSFGNYLETHPDVAKQLRKDPSLASNPAYLANHPELKQYLEDHLGVREEIHNNPKALFQREGRYIESTRSAAATPISLPPIATTFHGRPRGPIAPAQTGARGLRP